MGKGTRATTTRWIARIAAVLPIAWIGCGSSIPEPASAPPPATQYLLVPYPPPPGRVELVPEPPADDLVWVGGFWRWEGFDYAWQRGAWYEVAEGSRYARSDVQIRPDGTFHYAEGGFVDALGALLDPQPLAYGDVTSRDVVTEEGEDVDVGPNQPASVPADQDP